MLSCSFNFLDTKDVKELYERRQEEKIESQDIFYILPLFLGSTTIQILRKFFLNTNEIVASPSQCVSRYWVYMFEFRVQGVNNVLDALGRYV